MKELDYFVRQANMEILELNGWLSYEIPDVNTWGAVAVLKNK